MIYTKEDMKRAPISIIFLCLLSASVGAEEQFGINERPDWKNTKLLGSPEPPLPYGTSAVFETLSFERPIYAKPEPGTGNLIVIEQGGEKDKPTKIFRVTDSATVEKKLLLQVPRQLVYGLAFDPAFATNGYLYLFGNGQTGDPERTNQITRYTVDRQGEQECDPGSAMLIIEWRSMGHDGGELGFGRDGMLYISSGDGTSDSDVWYSAQDLSNLNGGVLRIDVGNSTAAEPYRIPNDNPFLDVDHARGELWAFGLRNPWRLWSDRESGQIWVGNNGQDLWETVHLIRRGENYGWSVFEGNHPFYVHRQRGPAPITPPTVEHHHVEARSLTGGVVYRGDKLPELEGAYIYGDYSTGKIWAVRHDGDRVTYHQELADTTHQIAGFAISPDEQLLVVDHGGGIFRIVPNATPPHGPPFPHRLSETDLFDSIVDHQVATGVIPYSVNAPAWNDGAVAQRFLAIPSSGALGFQGNRGWNFPNKSVLLQTLSTPGPNSRRIETRILVRIDNEWSGYSYRWNEAQTDAELVDKRGTTFEIPFTTEEGTEETQVWRVPSRAECLSCHSRAVNFVLGMSTPQLNRDHEHKGVSANQIRQLEHLGMFQNDVGEFGVPLSNPYDESASVADRARAYLHANCSSCHVEAGGGNARMELESNRELTAMRLLDQRPQHATFGVQDAMLVAPGEPQRSILMQRVSRRGPGQMPPIFTSRVDDKAVALLREWISSLPKTSRPFVRNWTFDELRREVVSGGGDREKGKKLFNAVGCAQCHRTHGQGGGAGPDLTRIRATRTADDVLRSMLFPAENIAPEYALTNLVTSDGRVLEGRVEFEDANVVHFHPTSSFGSAMVIEKSEIEARAISKNSMMPSGMLNTMTKEEILQLMSYLLSPMRESVE